MLRFKNESQPSELVYMARKPAGQPLTFRTNPRILNA